MADTLTGFVRLAFSFTHTKDLDLADPVSRLVQNWEEEFAAGTGAAQIDKIFHDTRTLAGGANEALDLAGSLTDQYGATITFVSVKFLAIRNNADSALTVGATAANQFAGMFGDVSDAVVIPAATATFSPFVVLICCPAGVAVTAGTGDNLKIALAAGTGGTYDIIIVGDSA